MTIDARFHTIVVPHLEAGRRLARWIARNDDDADDVVQAPSPRSDHDITAPDR